MELTYIQNNEDYETYKLLKPVKYYARQKVKFICSICKKESIKTFRYLTPDLICRSCQCRNIQLSDEVRSKIKATNIKRYGVENVFQSDEIKMCIKDTSLEKYGVQNVHQNSEVIEKTKETNIKRYGVNAPIQNSNIMSKMKQTIMDRYNVENIAQNETIKEKIKYTNIERYGTENPIQNEKVYNKVKNTTLQHYGVDCFYKSNECAERLKSANLIKYGTENILTDPNIRMEWNTVRYNNWIDSHNSILHDVNLEYIDKNDTRIMLRCMLCNTEFTVAISTYYPLLRLNKNFCPTCNKSWYHLSSRMEKELLDYIKTIYNSNIISNDRNILKGKEIDIYLPDIKLGFEFDGSFWHADPRLYSESDIIYSNITAKDIWQKDKEKDLLAESLGIKLIRIKEYDWLNNKQEILIMIKNIITTI